MAKIPAQAFLHFLLWSVFSQDRKIKEKKNSYSCEEERMRHLYHIFIYTYSLLLSLERKRISLREIAS